MDGNRRDLRMTPTKGSSHSKRYREGVDEEQPEFVAYSPPVHRSRLEAKRSPSNGSRKSPSSSSPTSPSSRFESNQSSNSPSVDQTGNSQSSPPSIASYIHRFRTAEPTPSHERSNLPKSEFWWKNNEEDHSIHNLQQSKEKDNLTNNLCQSPSSSLSNLRGRMQDIRQKTNRRSPPLIKPIMPNSPKSRILRKREEYFDGNPSEDEEEEEGDDGNDQLQEDEDEYEHQQVEIYDQSSIRSDDSTFPSHINDNENRYDEYQNEYEEEADNDDGNVFKSEADLDLRASLLLREADEILNKSKFNKDKSSIEHHNSDLSSSPASSSSSSTTTTLIALDHSNNEKHDQLFKYQNISSFLCNDVQERIEIVREGVEAISLDDFSKYLPIHSAESQFLLSSSSSTLPNSLNFPSSCSSSQELALPPSQDPSPRDSSPRDVSVPPHNDVSPTSPTTARRASFNYPLPSLPSSSDSSPSSPPSLSSRQYSQKSLVQLSSSSKEVEELNKVDDESFFILDSDNFSDLPQHAAMNHKINDLKEEEEQGELDDLDPTNGSNNRDLIDGHIVEHSDDQFEEVEEESKCDFEKDSDAVFTLIDLSVSLIWGSNLSRLSMFSSHLHKTQLFPQSSSSPQSSTPSSATSTSSGLISTNIESKIFPPTRSISPPISLIPPPVSMLNGSLKRDRSRDGINAISSNDNASHLTSTTNSESQERQDMDLINSLSQPKSFPSSSCSTSPASILAQVGQNSQKSSGDLPMPSPLKNRKQESTKSKDSLNHKDSPDEEFLIFPSTSPSSHGIRTEKERGENQVVTNLGRKNQIFEGDEETTRLHLRALAIEQELHRRQSRRK